MIKRLLNDWKLFTNKDNILIYQMGKVGSTSLEETIPGSIHIHSLYANWPCQVFMDQRRKGFLGKAKGAFYDSFTRVAIKRREKIKIITIVRDVYSRNVSMYFQNLQHWLYKYANDYRYDNRFESIKDLFEAFDKVFDHKYALTWFDKEINRFTGVDIYDVPFDKDAGFLRIQKGKYDILVLKLESMESNWSVIEGFVEKKINLVNANISIDKWYYAVYRNFLEKYRPSEHYLHLLYNSKLINHFYTPSEVSNFKKRALRVEK